MTPPAYHVVFADDNHDLICVAVPARTIGEAIEQVHTAVDFCPDVKVFEHPPLWPVGRAWSIDELEDHYDS